jgi:hypothetical protein
VHGGRLRHRQREHGGNDREGAPGA